ncbi:hypothetical protein PLESTB_000591600 [Pleodorina starrii]|uniref:Uncharacterized protein n=1 Tax=Pleodorina starrii TaxID=330485 RepID=A0A9W6BIR4_9CHLO|nr:hypothetical protein PLESTM_000764900 [Pleodorina starrii]GLC52176.1 hypothetical protein PLESTB_000591600 [Pleodorina starrii]GLC75807.1 hypothetical protein PLESTF_001689700 [Pleodorina starrii]
MTHVAYLVIAAINFNSVDFRVDGGAPPRAASSRCASPWSTYARAASIDLHVGGARVVPLVTQWK